MPVAAGAVDKADTAVVVDLERQDAETAVAEGEEMLGGLSRAAAVVDHDRARVRTGIDIHRHEGQPATSRRLDQPVAILDALDDEAVDEGAVDAPGGGIAIDRRNQSDAGAPRVTDLGDADHEFAVERIVEEVAEVVHRDDADGIDAAGPQQAPLGVGAVIAERAAPPARPARAPRGGPVRAWRRHWTPCPGKPRLPGRHPPVSRFVSWVIDTPSSEPIQFVD